jgi:hypothetical protein
MSKKDQFKYVLFFGAIWGILEATLGYVLQFLPPLVSGAVMFPIAAAIMVSAYSATENKKTLVFVAVIAASIKSVNFLLPGLMPIKTYNPIIAIMLQSMLVFMFIGLYEKKRFPQAIASFIIVSVGWRLLFLANIAINHELTGFKFQQLSSFNTMISFTLYQGLMGVMLLTIFYSLYLLTRNKINLHIKPSWALSLPLVIIALLLTFYL